MKAFSSVSIRISKYFEDLQCSDDVFCNYSVCSQAMIMLLLLLGQRLCFSALKGQLGGSRIAFLHALIATIYLYFVCPAQ